MTDETAAPNISVVIPAYNAAWCVRRAVDSVLAQSYADRELIVVDDGSTDETAAALAAYGAAVRVVSKPNGGLSSARNAGIRAARGSWVAFLDADDWWLPGKLAAQAELVDRRPDLVFCSTAARVESPGGELLNCWRCANEGSDVLALIFRNNAYVAGSGSAVMARRSVLLECGGFDESLASLEDIDMWMRLASRGGYACVDEPLVVILKRPDSMSRHFDVMRQSAITVMRKNRALLPPRLRGAYWRRAYAGMLADYAKWAYRDGRRALALKDLLTVLALSPLSHGRLAASLLATLLLSRPLPPAGA